MSGHPSVPTDSPPFTPSVSTLPEPIRAEPHPLMALIGAMAGGFIAAIPLGSLVFFAAYARARAACQSAKFCDLEAAIEGILIGGAVGCLAYGVAGVLLVRRWRQPGRRWGLTTAHLAAPFLLVATAIMAAGLG